MLLRGDYQKVEIFDILGPCSHPRKAIGVKFCVGKRIDVRVGLTKFHVNRYNESPLRGKTADFGL